jgi:hypothetical protein
VKPHDTVPARSPEINESRNGRQMPAHWRAATISIAREPPTQSAL